MKKAEGEKSGWANYNDNKIHSVLSCPLIKFEVNEIVVFASLFSMSSYLE